MTKFPALPLLATNPADATAYSGSLAGISSLNLNATKLQRCNTTATHNYQHMLTQLNQKKPKPGYGALTPSGMTLHYIRVKYKTAKPQLYTVYRTRNQQDAQLSQRDRAAGCVIVFAKSRTLERGDNDLRIL